MKNKMIKIVATIIMGSYLIGANIMAAPFKAPSSLVNMPIAQLYKTGDSDFSIATGINSIKEYQFDIGILYALNERLKGGVTLINYQKAVLNFQATFIDIKKYGNLKIAGGILNLTQDPSLNTWDNQGAVNSNHLMHFLVSSQDFFGGKIHYGITKRRHAGIPSILNGILFGFNRAIGNKELILDFDGANMNFGIILKAVSYTHLRAHET